mmetsp:Transcript_8547/g.26834  ORF Transcript_8547/g.26834 Transcript_8547/m.26834 type:complete len:228 (-) Transcript_8547:103-786(-)
MAPSTTPPPATRRMRSLRCAPRRGGRWRTPLSKASRAPSACPTSACGTFRRSSRQRASGRPPSTRSSSTLTTSSGRCRRTAPRKASCCRRTPRSEGKTRPRRSPLRSAGRCSRRLPSPRRQRRTAPRRLRCCFAGRCRSASSSSPRRTARRARPRTRASSTSHSLSRRWPRSNRSKGARRGAPAGATTPSACSSSSEALGVERRGTSPGGGRPRGERDGRERGLLCG